MYDSPSPQTAFTRCRSLAESCLDGVLSSDAPEVRRERMRRLLEAWEGDAECHPHPESIECARGCTICCHYPVGVTLREIDLLLPALREVLEGSAGEDLRQRIEDTYQRVRDLPWDRQAAAFRPCPLLDAQGSCSVYPARPVACRGWTSTSRSACELTLSHREPIPFEPTRYFGALGVGACLERTPPHPAERYELVRVLHAMLRLTGSDPPTLSDLRAALLEEGLEPLERG